MYVYIIKWFAARVAFFLAILLVLHSVDLSVREGIDALLFSGPILTALLISLFVLALQSNHRLKYAFLLTPKNSLKQRLPASRAPPTF